MIPQVLDINKMCSLEWPSFSRSRATHMPWKAIALKRWITIDKRWNKKATL